MIVASRLKYQWRRWWRWLTSHKSLNWLPIGKTENFLLLCTAFSVHYAYMALYSCISKALSQYLRTTSRNNSFVRPKHQVPIQRAQDGRRYWNKLKLKLFHESNIKTFFFLHNNCTIVLYNQLLSLIHWPYLASIYYTKPPCSSIST